MIDVTEPLPCKKCDRTIYHSGVPPREMGWDDDICPVCRIVALITKVRRLESERDSWRLAHSSIAAGIRVIMASAEANAELEEGLRHDGR